MMVDDNTLEFLRDFTAEEIKASLASAVAEQDKEQASLTEALRHPRTPIEPLTQKMLGEHGYARYTNVDLIRWRIAFWGEVKNRLLNWYVTKRDDEASADGPAQPGS